MSIRTGIFGGSFNPIHNGHIHLARQLLREAKLDEVWFLITPQNPWKEQANLMPDDFRYQLTKAALRRFKRLKASDFEFKLPKPSYTWNTLQALSDAYPDREFILLIGGDNWVAFDKWYHYEDILAHYSIAVYPRKDAPIDPATLPQGVLLMQAPTVDVSSTDIRQRLAQGLPIDHLVPRAVAKMLLKL